MPFKTAAATVAATPAVTAISPNTGSNAGGTVVTITGTGFTGATAVNFGGKSATNVTASTTATDTSITVTSPATTTAGVADVTVITSAGTSTISSADRFTYVVSGTGTISGTSTGGTPWGTQAGGTLGVTSITSATTTGTAGGGYAGGWSYIFNITVPTTEPNLSMMFSNWLDSSSDMIPVAGNMQISSAQASSTAPVTITAVNTFSSPALDMIGNLSTSTPGLHVQVLVQTQIPLNTVNGSYSTTYGVKTQ
jgi:hypothetical protein